MSSALGRTVPFITSRDQNRLFLRQRGEPPTPSCDGSTPRSERGACDPEPSRQKTLLSGRWDCGRSIVDQLLVEGEEVLHRLREDMTALDERIAALISEAVNGVATANGRCAFGIADQSL
jgi:hypothetical protein